MVKALPKSISTMYSISVVSPRSYFLFTALLPAAAFGSVETRSIVEAARKLIEGKVWQDCPGALEQAQRMLLDWLALNGSDSSTSGDLFAPALHPLPCGQDPAVAACPVVMQVTSSRTLSDPIHLPQTAPGSE